MHTSSAATDLVPGLARDDLGLVLGCDRLVAQWLDGWSRFSNDNNTRRRPYAALRVLLVHIAEQGRLAFPPTRRNERTHL